MIFPQLSVPYYDEPNRGILNYMDTMYAAAITINQAYWVEADTDLRFLVGDQSIWNDLYGNLPITQRKQLTFNRIRPIINMISGHQRQNRKSSIVIPIEDGDGETADQFTKILMWNDRQEGVLETISDAFEGALTTGMNLLHLWVDYRNDPISGNIKVDNCAYNSFLMDPYFRKADLSDCNYVWKRSFLSKKECISLMPAFTDEILGLQGNLQGTGRDGKFQYEPESYNYSPNYLLSYDEFWYRDFRNQKLLIDSETGETTEWRGKDDENLTDFLNTYPSVVMQDTSVPTVKLAVVIQNKVFYNDVNPLNLDNYPFIPVFAYYNPQTPYFENRIQGVVRGLRDAQFLYNRRKIIELDSLEATVVASWKYKEDALIDPKSIFLSGQGRGIALKQTADMNDVQQIPSPVIPPTTIEVSKILSQEIMDISGVNQELMGSATDDKAGILSMLRQRAGVTTLQILYDNLDRAQKLLGQRRIDIIQNNFTPGKVQKILEGQAPTKQFYNRNFGKYSIAIEDGLLTTTQKQQQFAQLMYLKEAGVPISTQDLLESATIQGKKKIIENALKQEQQVQQQQQMQMQLQMQQSQWSARETESKIAENYGLAAERNSRVKENDSLAVERIHQANRADNAALLDKIRALVELDKLKKSHEKELEGMDLSHLEKLLSMATQLKQSETQTSEQGLARSVQSGSNNKQPSQMNQLGQQSAMGL